MRLSPFWIIPVQLHHSVLLLFHEDMFWRAFVRGHVSRRPKSLVGSWTVFLTAEATGWIVADPHPEQRADWLGTSPGSVCTVTPPEAARLSLNFPRRGDDGSRHGHPRTVFNEQFLSHVCL